MRLLGFILILFSFRLAAYDGFSDYAEIDTYRIREPGTNSVGNIIIRQNVSTPANPGNCSDTSWLLLPTDNLNQAELIFSSVLAAFTTGTKVKFELDGCHKGGTQGSPVIVGIYVD